MVTVYKLTTQDNKTRKGEHNECTWGPGVTHSGTGKGGLCGPGYIHAYLSPELAVLLNPIHANIRGPKLWECSVSSIDKSDKDLKVGSLSLTTVQEISLPIMTRRHRVIFAILCAKKAQESVKSFVSGDKPWQISYQKNMSIFNEWAESLLSSSNSPTCGAADAARAAARAAASAARAASAASVAAYAADAAADAAADVANVANVAANAAAYAADAAAGAASRAARAADAAYAASAVASAAADVAADINLVEIAKEAMAY